ncbi:oxidoreductase [Clostridia bacterium]|nr:oxidoreductase [Clostridia bacterium]
MLRVAVVGTGNISRAHIPAWLAFPDRAKIVAMVDIFPEKAVAKSQEFGVECEIFDDHLKILDRDDIDLVDICTPPFCHAQIAINSLRAGKNVIVEKPMAASLEECDQMLQAERESGKTLACIAQNRFRTPIARLKSVLDSGLAGPVRHAQIDSLWWRGHCYYDLWWRGLWTKEGGGCTLNHAVHHIDMLGWMMGLPQTVSAVMANTAHDNAEVEDLSVAVFSYPGALATATSSVVHHGEEQSVQFQCEKARIGAPWHPYASVSKSNGFPERNNDLEAELNAYYESLPTIEHEAHTGEIENVISAIEQGVRPAITGIDGRRTIEMITAIYKSGALHEQVSLPISQDDPFYTVDGMLAKVPHFYEKTTAQESLGDGVITVGSDYKK